MAFVRSHIQHVIYIVKENRTFDQILGDLGNGSNGDPSLTHVRQADHAELPPLSQPASSRWTTSWIPATAAWTAGRGRCRAASPIPRRITQQINYALVNRGLSYETEGTNRNVPVELRHRRAARRRPPAAAFTHAATRPSPAAPANLLAGTGNHAATDAPVRLPARLHLRRRAASRRHASATTASWSTTSAASAPTPTRSIDPFASGVVQVAPLEPDAARQDRRLLPRLRPELSRPVALQRVEARVPAVRRRTATCRTSSLVRFSHDHTGSFGTALGGVNTPERSRPTTTTRSAAWSQAVANSPLRRQHADHRHRGRLPGRPRPLRLHRATAYVVGPYVKQGAVVSTRYNQVSVLRTIEDILGTPHINLNTAYQRPMADVFDTARAAPGASPRQPRGSSRTPR